MEKFKKTILPITTFVPIDVKRLFRDKVGIFFVFIFPLVFLLIFGNIFGGGGDVSFSVGLINHSNSEIAKNFVEQSKEGELLEVDKEVTDITIAREKMSRSEIEATIILPEDFGAQNGEAPSGQATVLYNQNNENAAQTLGSILEGQFEQLNARFVNTEKPFTVAAESTATEGLTRFDYTFSGLLGFTILSLGIFGPTNIFPKLKQRGVLRRYKTTTIRVWQYFVGNVISQAIIGLLAVGLMFIVALILFDLEMRGDYLSLALMTTLGVITLFGIGLAVGGWAKNENQAAPLAQLVTFPMLFLSGVFFPTFLMPELLQKITQFIPLTPIVEAIRLIVTEGYTIFELGPQLAIIGSWIVIIYVIAFKVFRWE
ncbi:MAG: ABC transporter permease [Candidatus Saccharibacteria bacterium]|nr:ABC transporter permease [Candidatus Saccharibacteria bacterium]